MPRLYFDVCEGTRLFPDEEGLEFDSLEAATAAAEIAPKLRIWCLYGTCFEVFEAYSGLPKTLRRAYAEKLAAWCYSTD